MWIITDIRHSMKEYWRNNWVIRNWDKLLINQCNWDIIDKKDWYYIITNWKNQHVWRV